MSKKKFKEKKDKRDKKERGGLYSALTRFLQEAEGKSYSVQQLVKKLSLKKKSLIEDRLKKKSLIEDLYKLLDVLEIEGKVEQTNSGQYKSTRKSLGAGITGVVDHVNPRFAYITTGEGGRKDIYIRSSDLATAIHGDTVEVEVYKKRMGEHPEGKVTAVIKRGRSRYVGRIELSRNFGFVVPDFKKIYQDFFIYPENLNGAVANDKVLFEVVKWGERDKSPEAKVVEILGKTGENEAEIHSIMAEFELPFRFPENVLKESEKISEGITPEEVKKRKDFRDVLTFTIDPEDAKDFDDAISFRKLENGNYEIGVHIADVTHYVQPGTLLDEDAFDRATSVYLVDRTVPMLPERLSNALCSLRPHEDKLTFAAVFEMDIKGKIHKEWFGRTVIHSNHRFTYEQAQEVIETGNGTFAEELKTELLLKN